MTQFRLSYDDVLAVVSRIDLGQVLYDSPSFFVHEKGDGYLLQLAYFEADVETGERCRQTARKWYVSAYSTETEIVRTAHKAVMASLEHRLGEHFLYAGWRIYSPHLSLDALPVTLLYACYCGHPLVLRGSP